MDTFIFYGDYAKQIQADNLQQVIGNNESLLEAIQYAAEKECQSYLRQKYDLTRVFKPITKHDKTKSYKAGDTVYLNADSYSAAETYTLTELVLNDGKVYVCSTAVTAPETFTPSKWTLLGNQYAIFWAILPKPCFDLREIYAVGDQVWWNDKVYTCRIATRTLSHEDKLQTNSSGSTTIVNTFPDDNTSGTTYWGTGVAYTIPAAIELTNVTYWKPGDNRDQKLLMICVDIALYHAHARIAPRNTPELRTHRYIGIPEDRTTSANKVIYPTYSALGWLQACANGDITPDMPIIQPISGKRIRFGGNAKLNNTY
jgi:hypothetical protein